MKLRSLLLLALLAIPTGAMDIPASWTTPVEPFRVAGNIYYVGTAELSSWLIVTTEGYVLLDAPLEENVPLILGNIEKLGFDPGKIRVTLGATTLVAYLTPGHTKGSTTWTTRVRDGDRALLVIFAPSLSAPGYKLVGNDSYPQIVENYRFTFDRLASLERRTRLNPCVFLSTHGSFFGLETKAAALRAGGTENPFVTREEFGELVEYWRASFEDNLEKQPKKQGDATG